MTEETKPFRFLTDEGAKKVAQDLVGNQIFCSDQLKNPDDLPRVFMVLVFADKKTLKDWERKNVVHFYEYLNKAGPVSVNGLPTFFSVRVLSGADYDAVRFYEERLRLALTQALE